MEPEASSNALDASSRDRSRGRGRSPRGGHGKYLRARGRGHRGGGRPAEFRERLLLEGEEAQELDEELAAELAQKYSRRQLGTNADRYREPSPELDSDGEEIIEPEVDLTAFLERQRLADAPEPTFSPEQDDDEDVDHSLVHITSRTRPEAPSRKGKVQQIEWDETLEQMSREKAVAEAHRADLKSRFKASVAQQRGKSTARGAVSRVAHKQDAVLEAPPLPIEQRGPPKGEREQMEEFLDDLLG
ncbi:hypothetical protein K488DRAFT_48568 [Vararia minispora EC-137]|uniref:Uncharacterized protein n=1 Tax=Vararia minispora EC-137 TaxID=1314806 RepID=A0ACB8QNS2_9AGAM|nr:hypothetical protein K488DRAFT_48568 [Vararia minispora EC-137]